MDVINLLNNLITKFQTSDPFKISEYLDITVLEEPLGKLLGYYNISNGYKIIHINCTAEEKCYICAHELAHAILHPQFSATYSSFYNCRYERQANIFAVNLILRNVFDDFYDFDIFQLARMGGIPKNILIHYMDYINLPTLG